MGMHTTADKYGGTESVRLCEWLCVEAQSLPDGAADSCDELASDRGGSKHHADNVAPSIVHAQAMLISVWT